MKVEFNCDSVSRLLTRHALENLDSVGNVVLADGCDREPALQD